MPHQIFRNAALFKALRDRPLWLLSWQFALHAAEVIHRARTNSMNTRSYAL